MIESGMAARLGRRLDLVKQLLISLNPEFKQKAAIVSKPKRAGECETLYHIWRAYLNALWIGSGDQLEFSLLRLCGKLLRLSHPECLGKIKDVSRNGGKAQRELAINR